ncbi:acetoacetyl-CoA synthetase [Desulfosarcina ovata subsp. sediminis]|uniref:Acetoacetyl-CoA synthetase n=1 Tax=Desulfosarcina ovata subsp. sediminis TaxID=885957 RepID=A0A5K7ZWU0_9BACT|nr:acetoacetate--CoA ligase [Desulfosarcina ovata]BBO84644.1 acetoacetyl-CoA synthetase [Desulfosarcina ovata subsp. sediminis]
MNHPKMLWKPADDVVRQSNMVRFMTEVNRRFNLSLSDYDQLWQWSIDHIAEFWDLFWKFAGIISSKPYDQVVDDPKKMPGARWFAGAELNFAENLLRFRDDRTALIFQGEGQPLASMTYAELYAQTSRMAQALAAAGVRKGDRVAGFMPNMPQTIIAMLAAVSLGAIWSSSSPDFGIKGVLDRFGQIEPKVLVTADGYFYNGKAFDSLQRVGAILDQLPMVEKVVVVDYTCTQPDVTGVPNAIAWQDFLAPYQPTEMTFVQVPAGHPLYVMYSSGTTGKPKCMVQSHSGILTNQLKEHLLHCDLRREDVLFYFTTCGWMMWNWLVCGLGVGASLVLYDGSPFHPGPEVLWKLAETVGITIFGTSARYITALDEAGYQPASDCNLEKLRMICSTGSPLAVSGFEYAYREIKADMQLASISGGTDLNGCFALGNPMSPVHAGELQGRGLALKVYAYDDSGQPVYDQTGELVCTAAFPSMPVYFWNDDDGQRYQNAYFLKYPGVWTHGDFISINSQTKGITIYGRSDATLNPGGVRIGTADIYTALESLVEVADSVVVGQKWRDDVRVVLFVTLAKGIDLNDALTKKIKTTIREACSPRHVPAKVIQVTEIPYTINMKKVELAVRNVIHGKPVTNRDALANPDCLDQYEGLEELKR